MSDPKPEKTFEEATREFLEATRKALGLDKPK